MTKYNLTLILVFFLIVTTFAQPQPPDTLWTKTYGGNNDERGKSVQQTTDGGYIIVGYIYSVETLSDVYLIKTDADGNEQWSQTFGGISNDHGNSVQQTIDGGYIIVGATSSFGAGSYDVYLIKTDANGNESWSQTFGGGDYDQGNSVQQTTDSGYIIAGRTGDYPCGGVYLIKTDADGNESWSQTFGGDDFDFGYSVQQTNDNGYIITGCTSDYLFSYEDVLLIKTDSNGDILWTQTFGGDGGDLGYCVQQTYDGGYIIVGTTCYGAVGSSNVYMIKTDANGNETWMQAFGGDNDDSGRSVQQTLDGGYIIAGHTYNFGTGDSDAYLIKTDPNGNETWSQTFGGNDSDYGWSVQQTYDGGYIITGWTFSYGAGESDVWLIRTDSETQPNPITITLTPFTYPIQIPSNGGMFEFNIEVANNSINPMSFDIWTMAILPNGSEYGPIISVSDFTAQPNWSADRDREQNIPESAPAGYYSYNAYAGIFPNTVWSEDHFVFEKAAESDGAIFIHDWDSKGEDFDDYFFVSNNPEIFKLHPCSPNPFNPSTELTFSTRSSCKVTLAIFDITGRKVSTLLSGFQLAGSHQINWNAENFPSGIYFARLVSEDGQMHTQKLLLIK